MLKLLGVCPEIVGRGAAAFVGIVVAAALHGVEGSLLAVFIPDSSQVTSSEFESLIGAIGVIIFPPCGFIRPGALACADAH